mgnify:CR=1 FL=1
MAIDLESSRLMVRHGANLLTNKVYKHSHDYLILNKYSKETITFYFIKR